MTYAYDFTNENFDRIASDSEPIGVTMYTGGSTSIGERNPSFTVLDIDVETLLPLNHRVYYLDISKANRDGFPTWQFLFSYLSTFGMSDLSPQSFHDLAREITIEGGEKLETF